MCCEDTSLHTADGDAFLDIFFINFEEAVRVCVCVGGGAMLHSSVNCSIK